MEHEPTLWEVLAEHHARHVKEIAKELRLDENGAQRLDDALTLANNRMMSMMRKLFGSVLVDRLEPSEIAPILFDLALAVGSNINSARSNELMASVQQGTRNMLAGLAAGATMALRDPAEGEGTVAAFGHLIPQEAAQ